MVCSFCAVDNPLDYVVCHKCGNALQVTAVKTIPATLAADVRDPTPQPQMDIQMRKCPFCAEEILSEAKKCKHCGEYVDITQSSTHAFSGARQGLPPYYQNEFEQIRTSAEQYRGKWNWAAFFFGGFWAVNKGLWKSGLVSIVGSFFTFGIVGMIYWFIFGARGNYMYYSTVVKRREPWI